MRCKKFLLVFILSLFFVPDAYSLNINMAPIVYYRSGEGVYEFSAFGPVVEFTSGNSAIRPLFYRDGTHTDILYPLGRAEKEKSRFSPLFRSHNSTESQSASLFPFFWGRDGGRSYWGCFPVYGHLYNRFGFDEARFIIWPAYSRTVRDSDNITYSVLWPVFTYSSGREFKLFPIYGRERNLDATYTYMLWPLFHRKKSPESSMHAFLPLFMIDQGPNNRSISILWPFFNYNRDDNFHHRSLDCPWPFLRFASGGYREIRFFPFYWIRQRIGSRKVAILWPLYSYSKDGSRTERKVLLLSSSIHDLTRRGECVHTLRIWPLFYRFSKGNHKTWHFPEIVPINDTGYKRNIAPLLTLIHSSYDGKLYDLDVLWHTFTLKKMRSYTRIELSFLFSYEHDHTRRRLGFLCDLLKINISS